MNTYALKTVFVRKLTGYWSHQKLSPETSKVGSMEPDGEDTGVWVLLLFFFAILLFPIESLLTHPSVFPFWDDILHTLTFKFASMSKKLNLKRKSHFYFIQCKFNSLFFLIKTRGFIYTMNRYSINYNYHLFSINNYKIHVEWGSELLHLSH